MQQQQQQQQTQQDQGQHEQLFYAQHDGQQHDFEGDANQPLYENQGYQCQQDQDHHHQFMDQQDWEQHQQTLDPNADAMTAWRREMYG